MMLLFVSRCFTLLNYIPAFSPPLESSAILLGNLLAVGIDALLLAPPLLLLRRFDGENAVAAAHALSRPLGFVTAVLYFLACAVQTAVTLAGLTYFMRSTVYPEASGLFILLSLAAACFLAARQGLEGIARAGAFVFVFLLLSALSITAVSLKAVEWTNFRPVSQEPVRQICYAALLNTGRTPELFLLILLLPKAKGNRWRCSLGFILLCFLILELMGFLVQGVLGGYAASQTFPYYTLASVGDTRLLQRMDALHMVDWVFTAFLRGALFSLAGSECAKQVLPAKAQGWTLPVLSLLALGGALAAFFLPELPSSRLPEGAVFLLTGGIPLLLLCLPKKKKPLPGKE